MYHGGINKIGKYSTFNESKATGYPNDYPILNYDFQTALSSYGEAREHYGMLNIQHLFLNDFGEILAPMEAVFSIEDGNENDLESLRYCMRTDGETGFVFINHYQRLEQMKDLKNVVIDTGKVIFPAIDVIGNVSFFMPFHMKLGDQKLTYATVQPMCRVGNSYFFMAIEGITPQYKFADGKVYEAVPGIDQKIMVGDIQIVTLTWDEARYTRKLSDKLYIGKNCDVYETKEGIQCIQEGSFEYLMWNGKEFELKSVIRESDAVKVLLEDVKEPFEPPFIDELKFNGDRKRFWKRIMVSSEYGFVDIPFQCDVLQIYADGELVADQFYYGKVWRIPAKILYAKECFLVMSEMKDDFYREF